MQKNMSVDYEESLTIENLENTKQELRKSISHETRQLEQKTSNDALRAKQQIIQKQRKHAQHTLQRVRTVRQNKQRHTKPHGSHQTKPPDTRNGTSTWLTLKPHKDSTSEDFHRPTRKISQIHTLNSYNRKDSPPSHKCVYYWVTTCAFMDVLAVSVPSLSFLNTTTRVLSDHNSHTLFCFVFETVLLLLFVMGWVFLSLMHPLACSGLVSCFCSPRTVNTMS